MILLPFYFVFLFRVSEINASVASENINQADPSSPICSTICGIVGNTFSNCEDTCEMILNGNSTSSQECRNALTQIVLSDPLKLSELVFSSGEILPAIGVISQLINGSSEAADFVLYLNDFGSPYSCEAITNATYCIASTMIEPLELNYGICVPDSCDEISISSFIDMLNIPVAIDISCGFRSYDISTSRAIAITIFSLLGFFLAIGTLLEFLISKGYYPSNKKNKISPLEEPLLEESNDPPTSLNAATNSAVFREEVNNEKNNDSSYQMSVRLLLCFAMCNNFKHLFRTSGSSRMSFKSLDGIRVFSMLWVILGHCLVFCLSGSGYDNLMELIPNEGKGILARFSAQAITSAFFSVDTFFYISGFLLGYGMLTKVDRMKSQIESSTSFQSLLLPRLFFHRWLRITPAFVLAALLYTELLPLFDSGPLWNFDDDIDACHKYWWTNLVYISNLYPWRDKMMCFQIGWYLANDFQFFVFFAPLIYLGGSKGLNTTLSISFLVILGSTAYTLWLGFEENIKFQIFDGGLPVPGSKNTGYTYWPDYYLRPWTRVVPFAGGVIAACLWNRHCSSFRNLSFGENIFLTCVWVLLLFISVYGTYWAYQDVPSPIPDWLSTLYLAFSRPAWTLGLIALSFQCFIGHGGPVQKFLEYGLFAPFSRLSFCAYLVHPTVLFWYFKSLPGPIHFSEITFSVIFMGSVLGTFLLSIVLYLAVEAPVRHLEAELIGP